MVQGSVHRWRLVAGLLVSVVVVAAVTPLVVVATHPVVHGWDETVGFIAGILTASGCIAALLRMPLTRPPAS